MLIVMPGKGFFGPVGWVQHLENEKPVKMVGIPLFMPSKTVRGVRFFDHQSGLLEIYLRSGVTAVI